MTYAPLKRPESGAASVTNPGASRPRVTRSSHSALRGPAPLTIGPSTDRAEREADDTANAVVAGLQSGSLAALDRRAPAPTGAGLPSGPRAPSVLTSRIRQEQQRGGRPLDPEIRAPMERAFAEDFSQVQIHEDPSAADLARQLRARAFTVGHDVFFARGALDTRRPAGQRILAHELAHVVQRPGEATIRRLEEGMTDPEFVPYEAGEIVTRRDQQLLKQGWKLLAPGTVAVPLGRNSDESLVVPASVVGRDVHGGHQFKPTLPGKEWEAKWDAARQARETAIAAGRISMTPPTRKPRIPPLTPEVRAQMERLRQFQALPWDQQQELLQAHRKSTEGQFIGFTEEEYFQMEAAQFARDNQKMIDGSGVINTMKGHQEARVHRESAAMQGGFIASGILSMTGNLGAAELFANIGGMVSQKFARPSQPPVGPIGRVPYSNRSGPRGTSRRPAKTPRSAPRAPALQTRDVELEQLAINKKWAAERDRMEQERAGQPPTEGTLGERAHEAFSRAKPPEPAKPPARRDLPPIQDIAQIAPAKLYRETGGWLESNEVQRIPFQGYKLHVSATLENARYVAQVILPMLQKLRVPHKVAASVEDYKNPTNGKFIVVYPRNQKERARLERLIDGKLQRFGLSGEKGDFVPVEGEVAVGKTGGIYTRYGSFVPVPFPPDPVTGEPRFGIFKANKRGEAIDKDGKVVRYEGPPLNGRPINLEIRMRLTKEQWSKIYLTLLEKADKVVDDRIKGNTWAPPMNKSPSYRRK